MCIGTPIQVIRCEGDFAWGTDRHGEELRVDTLLSGPVQPGDWLVAFLGSAREIVSPDTARQMNEALAALAAALAGDAGAIEAAFADLIDREPPLPDFLRTPGSPSRQ